MCPGSPSSQAILRKSAEAFTMGKMDYNGAVLNLSKHLTSPLYSTYHYSCFHLSPGFTCGPRSLIVEKGFDVQSALDGRHRLTLSGWLALCVWEFGSLGELGSWEACGGFDLRFGALKVDGRTLPPKALQLFLHLYLFTI